MNIIINNRDLLRRYRELKDKLINGEIDEISVPQKNQFIIKISLEKDQTPFEKMLSKIKKEPLKLKRPEEDII